MTQQLSTLTAWVRATWLNGTTFKHPQISPSLWHRRSQSLSLKLCQVIRQVRAQLLRCRVLLADRM